MYTAELKLSVSTISTEKHTFRYPSRRTLTVLTSRLPIVTGTLVYTDYIGIAKYYDNRKAAVVFTADDWCETQDASFKAAIDACQARNIWITPGIVTQGVAKYPAWHYPPDWDLVRNETNEGFVEPASHSVSSSQLYLWKYL